MQAEKIFKKLETEKVFLRRPKEFKTNDEDEEEDETV